MPDFVNAYQPPGIYVEEEESPLVSTVGLAPNVVGIVGPSAGSRSATVGVTLNATTAETLPNLGISADSVVVRAADGTIFAEAEYGLTAGGGEDGNIGTTEDNTLTIARVSGSDIPDGAIVYVTYDYTDVDFYGAHRFTDFDDVADFYGQPLNTATGEITSPLSMAAKVAMENGANVVWLVSTDGSASTTTRSELQAAMSALEAVIEVNIIVPLPVGMAGSEATPGDIANVGSDLALHVSQASTDGYYRVGIVGFDTGVTLDPADVAATIASKRVMLAWPNRMLFYNGYTNETQEIGGQYLAAAYAGRMASQSPEIPLTKKQVRGFSGIAPAVLGTMSNTVKNAWSDGGVAVTEVTRDSRLLIRHGVSTDPTNIHTREISLVRAKDALVKLIEDTVDRSGMIGTAIDEDTNARVKGIVGGSLEVAVGASIIVSYTGLKVRQASVDPSVIEAKFQYQPAYPLNYVLVVFSISTTTGAITLADDLAAA